MNHPIAMAVTMYIHVLSLLLELLLEELLLLLVFGEFLYVGADAGGGGGGGVYETFE